MTRGMQGDAQAGGWQAVGVISHNLSLVFSQRSLPWPRRPRKNLIISSKQVSAKLGVQKEVQSC